MSIESWLDGRRTYAIAAGGRLAAVYLWANGAIGHEAAALVFGGGALATAGRAGGAKTLAAVEKLAKALSKSAPLLLVALLVVGCATLTGGDDAAKAAEKAGFMGLSAFIPPPFNLLIPAVWGIVEALGVIFAIRK